MIVVADKKQWDDIHADAKKNNKTVSSQAPMLLEPVLVRIGLFLFHVLRAVLWLVLSQQCPIVQDVAYPEELIGV